MTPSATVRLHTGLRLIARLSQARKIARINCRYGVSSTPRVPADGPICMKATSTGMTDQFNLEVAATPEHSQYQSTQHLAGSYRRIVQVYQRRAKMPRALLSVPEPALDRRIHRVESLVGKYDNAPCMDANLSDPAEFPNLHWQIFMEHHYTPGSSSNSRMREEFRGLQQSTLMNLRSLPVFGTTGPVLQCTRSLLSRVQNGSLDRKSVV